MKLSQDMFFLGGCKEFFSYHVSLPSMGLPIYPVGWLMGCSSEAVKMLKVKILKVKVLSSKYWVYPIPIHEFTYLSGLVVMTGCSSEAVKMPVVIAHQLPSGSAQSDSSGVVEYTEIQFTERECAVQYQRDIYILHQPSQ